MKILDAAILPSLVLLAGVLRRASKVLDLLAYLLDPDDGVVATAPPPRGTWGDATDEVLPEDLAALDAPVVVIPPEAGEMIAKATPRTSLLEPKGPLSGSIEHRRTAAIARFEEFDRDIRDQILEMRRSGRGRC